MGHSLHKNSEPMLCVQQALCRINRHSLLRIDALELRQGEHWCVFGGNGAGKTLLSRLLLGQLPLGPGIVRYAADFDVQSQVAVVSFEEQQRLWTLDDRHDISEYSDDAADSGTTVRQLVLDSETPPASHAEFFAHLLQTLELDALQLRGIRFLSSGQLRRAMIARALMGKRDGRFRLLVLDDPLESIDRQSREAIVALLQQWMDVDTCTLQLCRRAQDVLAGITHLAVMDGLQLKTQGPLAAVRHSAEFTEIVRREPALPEQLPSNCRSAETTDRNVPLIELRRVNAGYGNKQVLRELSWTMGPDNHSLIEGPNGCGKSTLLSLIDGENHKAYGQEVYLCGRRRGSGETVWDVKALFGVVSNELHNKYIRGWKVLDVVVSGFFSTVGLYDDGGDALAACARDWLRTLGIEAQAGHFYHEISYGQQRLVLLARAMVKSPRLLVLDEPCVGLDDYHRRTILGVVDRIAADTGTRILFVSHTSGEEPACINQRLRFEPQADGLYAVKIE